MYIDLAKSASILLSLGLVYAFFVNFRFQDDVSKQALLGMCFGGICVFGMIVPVVVEPGVIFDARSVMLSLASLFGGPVVAVVSSVIAGGYRLYLGGDGASIGTLVVLMSAICGLGLRYLVAQKITQISWMSLLLLGFIVHTLEAILFQFLPQQVVPVVTELVIPPMFLSFVPATLVLGLLMKSFDDRREERNRLIDLEYKRQKALKDIIRALSAAMESRDPYTAGHTQNVADIAVKIGQKLGLEQERLTGLELGALVHDIGKLEVPTSILMKQEKLTDEEFELIRDHAREGARILHDIEFDWPVAQIVAQHHERVDGSGYPSGLIGEEISIEARIVAVADTFDAMALDRPYRKGLGLDAAISEIVGGRGKKYDDSVVDAFSQLINEGAISTTHQSQ